MLAFKVTNRIVRPSLQCAAVKPLRPPVVGVRPERLKLGNLRPQPGSTRNKTRKGRGYGAGQGGTCGFGNRGQKSRSGSGVRPGFEGGQTPLYRRMPKLRGIAGGMPKGEPSYVIVNLKDIDKRYKDGDEVTLESLKKKGIVRATGKEAKLPLKVLATGALHTRLTIKAASFSESAKTKIEAAGATAEVLPQKPKWTKAGHKKMVRELKAVGLEYADVKRAKRVVALERKGMLRSQRLLLRRGKPAVPKAKSSQA